MGGIIISITNDSQIVCQLLNYIQQCHIPLTLAQTLLFVWKINQFLSKGIMSLHFYSIIIDTAVPSLSHVKSWLVCII